MGDYIVKDVYITDGILHVQHFVTVMLNSSISMYSILAALPELTPALPVLPVLTLPALSSVRADAVVLAGRCCALQGKTDKFPGNLKLAIHSH